MFPTTPPSGKPSPGALLGRVGLAGKIGAGLAVVVLVAGFALTLQLVHGAGTTTASRPLMQAASGLSTFAAQTPGATGSATAGATVVGGTPAPGATPTPDARQMSDVMVTQNQNMQVPCTMSSQPHYTVQLVNSGNLTVNWQIKFAALPNSSNPYWGYGSPDHGSIGPGQSIGIAISVIFQVPCGGSMYDASIVLTYPAGAWQPDLALTFAGTGPTPVPTYSRVVLVSGTLTNSAACPPSGTSPAPFTFAIENTGTTWTAPSAYFDLSENIGLSNWATGSMVVTNAPAGGVGTWLYPNETWTYTISPSVNVTCGKTYHFYIGINDVQGSWTMTFTDAIG